MTEVETLMVWGVIVSAILSSLAVLFDAYRARQTSPVESESRPIIEDSETKVA